MIPVLGAIGVSAFSTLIGKAVTALVERPLGGSASVGPAGSAFAAVLDRTRTTKSSQGSWTPLTMQPSAALSRQVGKLIGRQVAANGSIIELNGSIVPTLRYRLPTAAASVRIEVRNLEGNVVRTVDLGPQPGGLHRLLFDGRGLRSGPYVYRVVATDAVGLPIARVSTASGRVGEVRFEGGQAFLVIGGSLVPLTSVYSVTSDQPAGSTNT